MHEESFYTLFICVCIYDSLTQHKRMLDKGRTIREDLNLSSSSVTFLVMDLCPYVSRTDTKGYCLKFIIHLHSPAFILFMNSGSCQSDPTLVWVQNLSHRLPTLKLETVALVNIQVSNGIQIIRKFNRIQNSTSG